MTRSVEEIFESMGKTLREGVEDGAIHLNPPSKNFLKNHRERFSEEMKGRQGPEEKQEPPTEIRLERVQ